MKKRNSNIRLAAVIMCMLLILYPNIMQINGTSAYVYSLSDKCINTFSADGVTVTTEPSAEEPSTEPAAQETTQPVQPAAEADTDKATSEETTEIHTNESSISPATGFDSSNLIEYIAIAALIFLLIILSMYKNR